MTMHTAALLDDDQSTLGDAVERAWCAAWASLGYDGQTQIEETPTMLRVVTAGSSDLLLNAILRYRQAGFVERGDVLAALAPFRAAGRPPQWWLRLGSEPAGLRDRLYEVGMRVWGTPLGMALPLGRPLPVREPHGELALLRARHTEDAEAALRVICAVFDLADTPMRRWCIGNPRFMTYLARVRGTPAAALVMQVGGGVAGFFQVATLPRFRRRGIAHALMLHALHDAQSLGATVAALTASSMAESVYLGMGFRPACTFEQWMPSPDLLGTFTPRRPVR